MNFDTYREAIVDEEQLRLLPVFYWVSGGMTALFSLYFLIYVALGMVFVMMPATSDASAPPPFLGWIFVAIGLGGTLVVATVAILKILTGFWIRKRKHRVACLIVAGISCIEIPYGTLLGVFSFLVLLRPSVAALFASSGSGAKSSPAGAPVVAPEETSVT